MKLDPLAKKIGDLRDELTGDGSLDDQGLVVLTWGGGRELAMLGLFALEAVLDSGDKALQAKIAKERERLRL
jgi:hypothetical protein